MNSVVAVATAVAVAVAVVVAAVSGGLGGTKGLERVRGSRAVERHAAKGGGAEWRRTFEGGDRVEVASEEGLDRGGRVGRHGEEHSGELEATHLDWRSITRS